MAWYTWEDSRGFGSNRSSVRSLRSVRCFIIPAEAFTHGRNAIDVCIAIPTGQSAELSLTQNYTRTSCRPGGTIPKIFYAITCDNNQQSKTLIIAQLNVNTRGAIVFNKIAKRLNENDSPLLSRNFMNFGSIVHTPKMGALSALRKCWMLLLCQPSHRNGCDWVELNRFTNARQKFVGFPPPKFEKLKLLILGAVFSSTKPMLNAERQEQSFYSIVNAWTQPSKVATWRRPSPHATL